MPIDPGYIAMQFPGQPAPPSNPLEGAFKMMAGYMAGQAEMKKAQITQQYDLLKAGVQAGLLGVDRSGAVSEIPADQRYDQLKTKAEIVKLGSEAKMNDAYADAYASVLGGAGSSEASSGGVLEPRAAAINRLLESALSYDESEFELTLRKSGLNGAEAADWRRKYLLKNPKIKRAAYADWAA